MSGKRQESRELTLRERDEGGKENASYAFNRRNDNLFINVSQRRVTKQASVTRLLRGLFLPAGYPHSVSKDYLRFQILNALQAFCSSLGGLLASRAVLEGHGVGKAEASATDALLLTILQDIFGRLVTIMSGYYLGTWLFPEAKTFRLLADILNDMAMVLDSFSPYLSTFAIDLVYLSHFPFVSYTLVSRPSWLRGVALCFSGVFRALCGCVAGGSKTAITLHFAQPDDRSQAGDVGDLSAKDGSKETVLALFGMLCGSALMPYVNDARTTYSLLAVLVVAHIVLNYFAVRGVVLRSLNRQRAGLLWHAFRNGSLSKTTPTELATQERIFAQPSSLYQSTPGTSRIVVGHCYIGSPLASILPKASTASLSSGRPARWVSQANPAWFLNLIDRFTSEKFIVWFDRRARPASAPLLHIILKDGHTTKDHLKAWVLATELASRASCNPVSSGGDMSAQDLEAILDDALRELRDLFPAFLDAIPKAGWDLAAAAGGFVTGHPLTLYIEPAEDKKSL